MHGRHGFMCYYLLSYGLEVDGIVVTFHIVEYVYNEVVFITMDSHHPTTCHKTLGVLHPPLRVLSMWRLGCVL